MKKRLLVLLLAGLIAFGVLGCEKADAESSRVKAIVRLPDETIVEGSISDWCTYSNNATVTIDGVTYKTSWQNICIITEE